MITDLLTPEAQGDAYVWAAVLVAHAAIGVALFAWFSGRQTRMALALVALVYALFEAVQALISGTLLIWDSALDWVAVCLGALVAAGLRRRRTWITRAATLATLLLAVVGYRRRRK